MFGVLPVKRFIFAVFGVGARLVTVLCGCMGARHDIENKYHSVKQALLKTIFCEISVSKNAH